MARKRRQPKTLLAALKKAARQEFGFQPTRISKNRRKYAKSREKHLHDDGWNNQSEEEKIDIWNANKER